ncbi:hypothetical protein [Streptomyces lavenduligriseus]|uniref:DUF937 domain-containing protein n=1 Tax=Streptomyces lavenduligriseus TaxID=67315 RepID=A0ABT0P6F7_9ACTN|nr:hypothetical protein [Streptomyces lavenduligriseus]MCL3998951.1 hypothetical protein [Streptomyces lavenduligriseus]
MATPPDNNVAGLINGLLGSDGSSGLLGALLGSGVSAGLAPSPGFLRSVAEGVGRPITQELAGQAQELEGQAERIRQQALEIRDRLPDFPGH